MIERVEGRKEGRKKRVSSERNTHWEYENSSEIRKKKLRENWFRGSWGNERENNEKKG